jgi:hypothetical protein
MEALWKAIKFHYECALSLHGEFCQIRKMNWEAYNGYSPSTEPFSVEQSCENGVTTQRFGDCSWSPSSGFMRSSRLSRLYVSIIQTFETVCLHKHVNILMIAAETASETSLHDWFPHHKVSVKIWNFINPDNLKFCTLFYTSVAQMCITTTILKKIIIVLR